jgi:hypothetical protein
MYTASDLSSDSSSSSTDHPLPFDYVPLAVPVEPIRMPTGFYLEDRAPEPMEAVRLRIAQLEAEARLMFDPLQPLCHPIHTLPTPEVEKASFPNGIEGYHVLTDDDPDLVRDCYQSLLTFVLDHYPGLQAEKMIVSTFFDYLEGALQGSVVSGDLDYWQITPQMLLSHMIYTVCYRIDPTQCHSMVHSILTNHGSVSYRVLPHFVRIIMSNLQTRHTLRLIPNMFIKHVAACNPRSSKSDSELYSRVISSDYQIPMVFDSLLALVCVFPRELLRSGTDHPVESFMRHQFIDDYLNTLRNYVTFHTKVLVKASVSHRTFFRSQKIVSMAQRIDRYYTDTDKHPLRYFFQNLLAKLSFKGRSAKGKEPAVQQMAPIPDPVYRTGPPPRTPGYLDRFIPGSVSAAIHATTETADSTKDLVKTLGEIVPLTKTFLTTANITFSEANTSIKGSSAKIDDLVDHITSGNVYKKVGEVVSTSFTNGFENTTLSASVVGALSATGSTLSWMRDLLAAVVTLAPLLVPVVFVLSYASLQKVWSTQTAFVCGASALYTFVHYFSVIRDSLMMDRIRAAMSMLLTGSFKERGDSIPLFHDCEEEPAQQQAGLFEMDTETVGSLVSIFTSLGFSKASTKADLFKGCLKDVGSTSRGAGTIITTAMKILAAFVDDLKGLLGFNSDGDKDFTIESFSRNVTTIIAETRSGVLAVSNSQLARATSLHKEGLQIIDVLKRRKEEHHIATMNRIMKSLEDIIQKMRDLLAQTSKARPQPVATILKGLPGQGKTFLARYIETVLFRFELDQIKDKDVRDAMFQAYVDKPTNYCYHKGQDYYYDGISPCAMIVTLDDWLQRPGMKGSDFAPLMDFISAANTEPWFPRMAFSKEEKSVAPRYIIATTNATIFHDETISEPDAVYRRGDFIIEVKLKTHRSELQGFGTEVYSLTRLEWQPIHKEENPDPRKVKKTSEAGKFVEVGVMTVQQLLAAIIELRHHRAGQQTVVQSDMDKMATEQLKSLEEFMKANPTLVAQATVDAAVQQCNTSCLDWAQMELPEYPEMIYDRCLEAQFNDPLANATPSSIIDSAKRAISTIPTPTVEQILAHDEAVARARAIVREARVAATQSIGVPAEVFNSTPFDREDIPHPQHESIGRTHGNIIYKEGDVVREVNYSSMKERDRVLWEIQDANDALIFAEGKWRFVNKNRPRRQEEHVPNILRRAFYKATGVIYTSAKISALLLRRGIKSIEFLTIATATTLMTTVGATYFVQLCISTLPTMEEVKTWLSDAFGAVCKGIYNAAVWLKEFLYEHRQAIGVATAIIVPTIALVFGLSRSDVEDPAEPQDSQSVFAHKAKIAPRRTAAAKPKNFVRAVDPKMGFSQHDAAVRTVRNNMWEVWAFNGTEDMMLGYANFVFDNVAHFPYHFIGRVGCNLLSMGFGPEKQYFVLKNPNHQEVKIPWTEINILNEGYEGEDKCIAKFETKALPTQRNVSAHYVSEAEMGKEVYRSLKSFSAQIVQPQKTQVTPAIGYAQRSVLTLDYVDGQLTEYPHVVENLLKYNFPMEYGDCGSLIMTVDGTSGGRICGAHIAGDNKNTNPSYGYSYRITREEILNAAKVAVDSSRVELGDMPDFKIELENDDFSTTTVKCAYDVNIHKFAVNLHVTPPSGVHSNCMIVPFLGATGDYVERKTEVCDTSPQNYPIARAPYCARVLEFADSQIMKLPVLEVIAKQIAHELKSIPWPRAKTVYTFLEALDKNDLSTSSGYPYQAMGLTKKHFVWKTETGVLRAGPRATELRDKCRDNLAQLRSSGVPVWVYQDVTKVERRKFSKLRQPRLVSGAPFDAAVTGCMLFGAFSDFMCETTMDNETLIGFDPYTQASGFVERFMRFGPLKNIACLDYTGFDTDHGPIMVMLAIDIINMWYDDEPANQRARVAYGQSIAHSYHIRGGVLELWPGSTPSGNYLTTLINCLINLMNLRWAFYRASDNQISCIPHFKDHVVAEVLGDDNAVAVSPDYIDKFSEAQIAKYVGELGYRATSASKDKPLSTEMTTIDHLELLKRTPRREPLLDGRYVLPLNIDTVLEIPLWTKKDKYTEVACTNLDTSLHELSLHGQEAWDLYTPKMAAFFSGIYNPVTWNRKYYLERTLKEGFFKERDLME